MKGRFCHIENVFFHLYIYVILSDNVIFMVKSFILIQLNM